MIPVLIAHRGEPGAWPENSLAGYRAALAAGAACIETDVQITADAIPVLSHDPNLLRLTGHNLSIAGNEYRTLSTLPAGYPERFGERFADLRITRLDALAMLLEQWPEVRAFIEIKTDAIKMFGVVRVLDIVLEALGRALPQCIIISFNRVVLFEASRGAGLPIGWVLPSWSPERAVQASELRPEYLFCNRKRVPPGEALWRGPWQWAGYTVNDADEVLAFGERGFSLLETDCISRLLGDPRLGRAGHD